VADTLLNFQEAMNGLPDNTTRLIQPANVRGANLSLMQDYGGNYADPAQGPWTVPIPAVNTWVDIPQAIGGAAAMVLGGALFWRQDANGHLKYDYLADWPTTVVPAGYTRIVRLLGVVTIDPGNITWEFAFTIGGVIQLPTYVVDSSSTSDALSVSVISGDPIDVSLAPPVSMSVRNLTNADDLPLQLLSMRTTGAALA